MAKNEQIGQRRSHKQSVRVLAQSAVADAVLDLGPDLGLGAVPRLLCLIDDPAMPVPPVGEVFGIRRAFADHLTLTLIGSVALHPGLLAIRELR
jgi:hypothetical protein